MESLTIISFIYDNSYILIFLYFLPNIMLIHYNILLLNFHLNLYINRNSVY